MNLGEVMLEGEQVTATEVTPRLGRPSESDGICISGKVREEIGDKLALHYEDNGGQMAKKIAWPDVFHSAAAQIPGSELRLTDYSRQRNKVNRPLLVTWLQ